MPGSPPSVDATSLRTAAQLHATLFARFQTNTDVLWRIIAFTLTAEGSLFVGVTQLVKAPVLRMILGFAIGGLAILGPVCVRFVETILLIDRAQLDQYERILLGNSPLSGRLRQDHVMDMRQRYARLHDEFYAPPLSRQDQAEWARINRRRFTGPASPRLNQVFDALGQPSVVFTFAMVLIGATGFDVGLSAELHGWPGWIACILANSVLVLLLALSMGIWGRVVGTAAGRRLREAVPWFLSAAVVTAAVLGVLVGTR
jgi:hypothetical protein